MEISFPASCKVLDIFVFSSKFYLGVQQYPTYSSWSLSCMQNIKNDIDFVRLFSQFVDVEASGGIRLIGHSSIQIEWEKILLDVSYLPIDYAPFYIDYQRAYLASSFNVHDMRMLILHDGKAIGIWPVSVIAKKENQEIVRLGSNAGDLLSPLLIDTTPLSVKIKVNKILHKALISFASHLELPNIPYGELLGPISNGLGAFHLEVARYANSANVSHFLYLDLSMSPEAIWANYRKSYKGLINKGAKFFSTSLMCEKDDVLWEEFRQLHIQVAGRETRSLESWTLQHKSIEERNAFLVYLRNETGEMIGGGFFQHTNTEVIYAVGAYDRNLFEYPLGHLVQHTAILEMKRRDLQWYRLGQKHYPWTLPKPSDKEIAISNFKEGFSTHQFVRIDVNESVEIQSRSAIPGAVLFER